MRILILIHISILFLVSCGGQKPTENAQLGTPIDLDHTAPGAPVITTPSASNYTYLGATNTFTISGTVDQDVVKLTGPNGAIIHPKTDHTWSYDATLTPNASVVYDFFAYDLAGNQSTSVSQTILWNPPAVLLLGGIIPGGAIMDLVSNYVFEASLYTRPGKVTDPGTNYVFETGFNYAGNSAR